MIKFKEYLLSEDRSMKQQSDSAYNILEQYKDDKDMYISFTQIDKIGINPQSDYNTPIGIYTYPLREIWKEFDHFGTHGGTIKVPFAGNSPYVWLLKKTTSKFIDDMYSDYGSKDYDNDMNKLRKMYKNHEFPMQKVAVDKEIKELQKSIDVNIPTKILNANITYNNKIDAIVKTNKEIEIEMKKYPKASQSGADMIKVNKKEIEKIEKMKSIIITKFEAWIESYQKDLEDLKKEAKYLSNIDNIIDTGTKKSRDNNAVSAFWNVTKMVSALQSRGSGTVLWNKLLRQLGYDGFADKSGKGIIHPSEPMQAIFLTTKGFKVVKKLNNHLKFVYLNKVNFNKLIQDETIELSREYIFIKKGNKFIIVSNNNTQLRRFILDDGIDTLSFWNEPKNMYYLLNSLGEDFNRAIVYPTLFSVVIDPALKKMKYDRATYNRIIRLLGKHFGQYKPTAKSLKVAKGLYLYIKTHEKKVLKERGNTQQIFDWMEGLKGVFEK